MNSLTAIVVTHNSGAVVDACLQSLGRRPAILVDNNSTDDTCLRASAYPSVTVIANATNRGFASAVNQAVCASDSDAYLLLNPDAELKSDVLDALEALRSNGLATGRLVDEHGKDQRGFGLRRFPTGATLICEVLGLNRLWPGNPVNARYRYTDRDLDKPGEVEQPAGAFLFFRREVWERLGGFDEEFHPIWFEDVDFCFRASQIGFKASYNPGLLAQHAGGHSIRSLSASCRATYWYASLLRYASKHFKPAAFRGVCVAVVLGAVPRLVLDTLRQRSFAPVDAYGKVIRLATLCLFTPALARPELALGSTGRVRG